MKTILKDMSIDFLTGCISRFLLIVLALPAMILTVLLYPFHRDEAISYGLVTYLACVNLLLGDMRE